LIRFIFLACAVLYAQVVTPDMVKGAFTKSQQQTTIAAASQALADSLAVLFNMGGTGPGGGVSSVGLAMPASVFTVTGSPVTSIGTLTATLASQTAHSVFMGPSVSTGAPTFRAFLPGDISFLTDSMTAARAYSIARIHDTAMVLRATLAALDTVNVRRIVHDTADTLRKYTKDRIHDSMVVERHQDTVTASGIAHDTALILRTYATDRIHDTSLTLRTLIAARGTVSSVGLLAPALMTASGSPVTGSGTLGLAWNGSSASLVRADGSTVAATTYLTTVSPSFTGPLVQNGTTVLDNSKNLTVLSADVYGKFTMHGGSTYLNGLKVDGPDTLALLPSARVLGTNAAGEIINNSSATEPALGSSTGIQALFSNGSTRFFQAAPYLDAHTTDYIAKFGSSGAGSVTDSRLRDANDANGVWAVASLGVQAAASNVLTGSGLYTGTAVPGSTNHYWKLQLNTSDGLDFWGTGNTVKGTISSTGDWSGSAAKWTTGRTISITGDLAYTSPSFDGSGNVTAAGILANTITAGGPTGSSSVVPVITYDAKGRLTTVTTATITPAAIGAQAAGNYLPLGAGLSYPLTGPLVLQGGTGGVLFSGLSEAGFCSVNAAGNWFSNSQVGDVVLRANSAKALRMGPGNGTGPSTMDITTSGVEVYTNLKVDATTTLASSLTGFLKGTAGVVSAGGVSVPDLPASIQTVQSQPADQILIGNTTSGATSSANLKWTLAGGLAIGDGSTTALIREVGASLAINYGRSGYYNASPYLCPGFTTDGGTNHIVSTNGTDGTVIGNASGGIQDDIIRMTGTAVSIYKPTTITPLLTMTGGFSSANSGTFTGSANLNMGTGTINAGSGGILTSGGGNISSNGSVSAVTDITTTGGKVQGLSVAQTVQSVAVSTTPAVNLANGGNVVLGASGVPGALTAATTITFSNPVIGSTTRLMFQQGTTSFAVTFTISGFTFYRSGKTAGIASGSVVLAAADMTLSQYNMVEITWLTSTKAFVALIKI